MVNPKLHSALEPPSVGDGQASSKKTNRPACISTGRWESETLLLYYCEFVVAPLRFPAEINGTVIVLSMRASMPLFTGRSTSLPFRATT